MPVVLGFAALDQSASTPSWLTPSASGEIEAGQYGPFAYRVGENFVYATKLEGVDGERGVFRTDSLLFVVDGRVDNRLELASDLGLSLDNRTHAELIYAAYLAVGPEVVDVLVGDFAFCAIDTRLRQITLVRDPTGQRPLHYRCIGGGVAFSSFPSGISEPGRREVCHAALARFVADVPRRDNETYFENIHRVLPGEIVFFNGVGRPNRRTYLKSIPVQKNARSDKQFEKTLYMCLEQAVRTRVDRPEARFGAHLSAGLDSSSILFVASKSILRAKRVTAYTAAPRKGFPEHLTMQRINDESAIADEFAASLDNVDHAIVRESSYSVSEILIRRASSYDEPLGHVCNQRWWEEILDDASRNGIKALLTGEAGNLAFSSGDLSLLSEIFMRGDLADWVSVCLAARTRGETWRNLFFLTLPSRWRDCLLRGVRRLFGRKPIGGQRTNLQFLLPRWRERFSIGSAAARSFSGLAGERLSRWSFFAQADPGCFRKRVLIDWGIEELDPLSDRRLIEFCLAAPPIQFIKCAMPRSLARRTMAGKLPESVLNAARGYQGADWFEAVDPNAIISFIDSLGTSAVVDLDALRKTFAEWPVDGFDILDNIALYRLHALRAVSALAFEHNVGPACEKFSDAVGHVSSSRRAVDRATEIFDTKD